MFLENRGRGCADRAAVHRRAALGPRLGALPRVLQQGALERRGAAPLCAGIRGAGRMSSAAKAIAWHGLKRRALSLGAMKAFDHAMQFLLPVVLVRALDTATFGEYRLLWLAIGT